MKVASDGFEIQRSRYVVGIDLGTTNCAVAYVDTQQSENAPIRSFPLVQWVDFGVQEPRELLPSFHYHALKEELKSVDGQPVVVGILAQQRAQQLPGRVIASAKSWLCHAGVDRTSPILPWQSDPDIEKISPVAACSAYLAWIRHRWDLAHADYPLSEQDVILTLPASFDQVARQLTIEAASNAGLQDVVPIEEPQAAFYAWLARNEGNWEELVQPGQTILVCDIGGGTTDFTLIRVRETADKRDTSEPYSSNANDTSGDDSSSGDDSFSGADSFEGRSAQSADSAESDSSLLRQQVAASVKATLHRVAVGNHLILGGDNIDVALARLAENKLTGGKQLSPRSWDALLAACRAAKESLLGSDPPEHFTIHLPGTGARLIGGGRQVQLEQGEVESVVLDGFFPVCDLLQRPQQRQSGFQEFGLPYAQDAAVTHHLAAFLWDHRGAGRTEQELASLDDWAQARPDWILFNGGVMSSQQITGRIASTVARWFAGNGVPEDWRPGMLDAQQLDLAVAFGAAYFGKVSRGIGVKIEAKLACSYYLQVANDPPLGICIVPGDAGPGDQYLLQQNMELMIGQPVQFPIVYSSTRLADSVGQAVELNEEEFAWLPPIRTVLNLSGSKRRDLLQVQLTAELSQIGTLQMWCISHDGSQRWRLEFDVRGSSASNARAQEATANQSGILDESAEILVRETVERTFGSRLPGVEPSKLVSEITQVLSSPRQQWPPNILRSLWQTLLDLADGRRKSAEHESRWLNLLGFALRPGYGMAGDDWRVAETWRNVHGRLAFNAASSKREARILWRRIAGGFTAGQQLTVYQQVAGPLRQVLDPVRRSKGGGKTGSVPPNDLIELLRLAGALELLPKSEKTQLGHWAVDLMRVKKYQACQSALCWCIARLGERQPTYGPLNCIVDAEEVTDWLQRMLQYEIDDPAYNLALMQCARKVGDRYRDVGEEIRREVLKRLEVRNAAPHYLTLVSEGGKLASQEAEEILGDTLPLGLALRG